jgi:non-heme chloroperoxidase
MPYYTTKDNVQLFYKDWDGRPAGADGPTVTLSHGWPLTSDNWDSQMYFLASNGVRVIAMDRRGHGRSDQPWHGNDVDTWAADLYGLIEHLDLKNVMMAGHSTGGAEVVRTIAKFGTSRISKAVLISSPTPGMTKIPEAPDGHPAEWFDETRAGVLANRSQLFKDIPTGPFFGYNRPGTTSSQGIIDSWWLEGMLSSQKASHDTTYSWQIDYAKDMESLDIPVLVLHGSDDQIVPYGPSAGMALKHLKKGTLKTYKGGPHALPNIHADEVNQDLLNFLKA